MTDTRPEHNKEISLAVGKKITLKGTVGKGREEENLGKKEGAVGLRRMGEGGGGSKGGGNMERHGNDTKADKQETGKKK